MFVKWTHLGKTTHTEMILVPKCYQTLFLYLK